jgi:hypothetical protein
MTPAVLSFADIPVSFGLDFEPVEFLNLLVGVFALILLALSLTAYRRTSLRRLLFVSAAFGLFAVEVVVRHLDMFVLSVGPETDVILQTVLDFAILLLFFFALVVEK